MRRFTFFASVATLAIAVAGGVPARAQAPSAPMVQTIPGPTPDADALAGAMRRLAENPRDVDALLTAGELSLRLGDASGAASLFKRAEQISPANGRVKAGMASILVRSERPGEALRYFGQAEGFGFDPRRFASDRALAYDLIGEQERAQRDYRLVLKANPDDETIRRYALSLGISGKQDEALEQIDTLLRKGDRGAWRARAFILAMSGDVAGATKIATTMIPGMARGLQPFFTRLAALGPADRAFAVNFGEVGPTPERLADARLTPALAPLVPESRPAPVLAAATPPTKAELRKKKRERRQGGRLDRIEVASAAPKIATLPPPPGFGSAGASPVDPVRTAPAVVAKRAPVRVASVRADIVPIQRNELLRAGAAQVVAQQRARLAALSARSAPISQTIVASPASSVTTALAAVASPPPVQIVSVEMRSPVAPRTTVAPSAMASVTTVAPPLAQTPPGTVDAASSVSTATITPSPSSAVTSATLPAPPPFGTLPAATAAAVATAGPTPPVAAPPTAQAVARATTPVAPRMSEDSILARIIAGISIPGSELGVESPPSPSSGLVPAVAVAPAAPSSSGTEAASIPVDTAAAENKRTEELAATKAEQARAAAAKADEARAALAEKKRADAKALAVKKAADAKALAAKKAADEKALAAKKAADEKKAAKADPPRVWVQVSGGAYEGDLPKAWAAVKAQAPALAGRQGYSTPLRATNRVVTGPFKTTEEAQAFVNTLGKQGVSAFTFTSTTGQKVTRLPVK